MKSEFNKYGLLLDETMSNQFEKYYELLIDWNQRMNLTTITDRDEVVQKHFIDSVLLLTKYDKTEFENKNIIDVGTGAGFPGIPLAIMLPQTNFVLIDSLDKRITFLKTVLEELGLSNVTLYHGRAEDFGKSEEYREKFDVATARAVAGLPILMEFCVPFVKVGGYFICLKGPNANLELEESKAAMDTLGIEFIEKIDIKLPDLELNHNILVFKKVKNTPSKYPRKAGKPSKNPIK